MQFALECNCLLDYRMSPRRRACFSESKRYWRLKAHNKKEGHTSSYWPFLNKATPFEGTVWKWWGTVHFWKVSKRTNVHCEQNDRDVCFLDIHRVANRVFTCVTEDSKRQLIESNRCQQVLRRKEDTKELVFKQLYSLWVCCLKKARFTGNSFVMSKSKTRTSFNCASRHRDKVFSSGTVQPLCREFIMG